MQGARQQKFTDSIRKILLLTLVTTILATRLFSQEITKEEIVKYKIKSITISNSDERTKSIEYFNDQGDIVKIGDQTDGDILVRKEFVYENNRFLMQEKSYTTEGKILGTVNYQYNSNNQLIKKESLDAENKVNIAWIYEYNDVGNKIKETQKSGAMSNIVTTFKYDEQLLVGEMTTNDIIGVEEEVTYKYNSKRQLVKAKTKHFYFTGTTTLRYNYNAAGKLIQLSERSSNGVSSTTTYQYDDKGLLTANVWRTSLGKDSNRTTFLADF